MTRETLTRNQAYRELINRPLPKHRGRRLPTISLFSGILGIEIGLERAGFQTRLALDFDKDARDVVEANRGRLGNFLYIWEDIDDVPPERILEQSGLRPGETALLAGGPPCQPFSK